MKKEPIYITAKGKIGTERYNEFKTFRINISVLRANQSLTGVELSTNLGMPKKRVNDFEIGRCHPTIHELTKIADYFSVTLDELLYKKIVLTFE